MPSLGGAAPAKGGVGGLRCRPVIAGFVSGFLPGLVLKLFLALLPLLLRTMSTFEGHPSTSTIVREAAIKVYYFQLVSHVRTLEPASLWLIATRCFSEASTDRCL